MFERAGNFEKISFKGNVRQSYTRRNVEAGVFVSFSHLLTSLK